MTELYYENYDGEMFFDIDSLEFSNNEYTFDIKSNYNGNEIGMHISIPVIVSRSLFKSIKIIKPNGKITFETIGNESDLLVSTFEELFKPPFESSKSFSDAVETLDYSVLNKQMYDLDNDKVFIKIYNGDDQSGLEEDEKINIELNLSLNFVSKRATISEVRDGYSSDIVAVLMK